MRSMLTATLILAALAASAGQPAEAQMTAPSTIGKPKPVTTIPVRPAPPGPADTANAIGQAMRLALQSDLAWVGQYNGAINGDASDRMMTAIKQFQKARGGKPTGQLSLEERGALAEAAKLKQDNVGWKIVTDAGTGARLGIPTKLVPRQSADANGAKWSSADGAVEVVLTRRKEAGPTTAKLADEEKKEPAGRTVDYSVVRPDFFVLSGMQGPKKFYLRGTFKGDEVRIFTIVYDPAMQSTIDPVVIAMSSAFNPFASGAQVAGPPPRKSVEYGTGIVVSADGAILADREITDGCLAVAISGFGNADRVADDRERGIALLRIYGARGLTPLDLAGAANANVELTGIADPQSQGGASAASSVKAAVGPLGSELSLMPAPPPGFSGAAARDANGKFAGLALLKPAIVAGPANAAPPARATLVPGEAVRDFLKNNGVDTAGGSTDARASVVRVICVRK